MLDVRTAMEYGISHIDGSVNISVSDIEGRLKELDKNKQYLVYCRSGARSNSAANTMRKNGFNNVSNMIGGMNNWSYDTTSSCCLIMWYKSFFNYQVNLLNNPFLSATC